MADLYLLTKDEQRTYKPVVKLCVDITHKYSAADVDDALNARLNADFSEACRKKRVRIQNVLDIAKSALEKKWFTIVLSGAEFTDENAVIDFVPRVVYSMMTSDNPDEMVRLARAEYPEFYKIDEEHARAEDPDEHVRLQRDALGLAEYLYVDSDTLRTLFSVVEVFDTGVPRISYRPIKSALYPVDKVNLSVWGKEKLQDGSLKINMKGNKLPTLYSINFPELKDTTITKELDSFDKMVYIAVSNLYHIGYRYMTASMIYNVWHDSRPSQKDIERINKSLTKMDAARIFIDNSEEVEAFKDRYPAYIKHRAPLLSFEQITIEVNGVVTDCAIKILSTPFLFEFATGRNQITTIPTALLSAVDHTDSNLRILHYLVWRIARADNSTKILYTTLQKEVGAVTAQQRHRLTADTKVKDGDKVVKVYPSPVKKILDKAKSIGYIHDYVMQKDAVCIFVTDNLKLQK